MIVPPRVERYTVNGYCSQTCTNAVSGYVTALVYTYTYVAICMHLDVRTFV